MSHSQEVADSGFQSCVFFSQSICLLHYAFTTSPDGGEDFIDDNFDIFTGINTSLYF